MSGVGAQRPALVQVWLAVHGVEDEQAVQSVEETLEVVTLGAVTLGVMQAPLVQFWPEAHFTPHLPQLRLSMELFTQTPLHAICPDEHAGAVVQAPLMQV